MCRSASNLTKTYKEKQKQAILTYQRTDTGNQRDDETPGRRQHSGGQQFQLAVHPGVAQGAHALEPLRRVVVATATPILARMPQALVAVDALGARLLVSRWASTRQHSPTPTTKPQRPIHARDG